MIHYRRKGRGPVCVLIHGFCENLEVWKNIEQPLSRDFDLILIDLPGFGKSPLSGEDFTIKDIARDIDNLLGEVGIDKYGVIGHSLGGYVGLSLASQFPEKISQLVLVNSTALPDSEEKRTNRNRVISFIEKYGVNNFLGEFVPSLFNSDNLDQHKADIEEVKAMGEGLSADVIIGYTKAMRDRPAHTSVLQESPTASYFIYGDKDMIFSADDIKQQTDLLPLSNILELKNCGHMSMYEDPANLIGFLISTRPS